jgi:hypothetical protein
MTAFADLLVLCKTGFSRWVTLLSGYQLASTEKARVAFMNFWALPNAPKNIHH